MAKTKKAPTKNKHIQKTAAKETDGAFFLKLVLYLVISSLWLRLETADGSMVPLPVGALLAVFFALHDHFQIDRKIEMAIILVAMFISFWLPIGIYVSL